MNIKLILDLMIVLCSSVSFYFLYLILRKLKGNGSGEYCNSFSRKSKNDLDVKSSKIKEVKHLFQFLYSIENKNYSVQERKVSGNIFKAGNVKMVAFSISYQTIFMINVKGKPSLNINIDWEGDLVKIEDKYNLFKKNAILKNRFVERFANAMKKEGILKKDYIFEMYQENEVQKRNMRSK